MLLSTCNGLAALPTLLTRSDRLATSFSSVERQADKVADPARQRVLLLSIHLVPVAW